MPVRASPVPCVVRLVRKVKNSLARTGHQRGMGGGETDEAGEHSLFMSPGLCSPGGAINHVASTIILSRVGCPGLLFRGHATRGDED